MTLRRFMAIIGFCYLLTAGTLVASLYLSLWMTGTSSLTVYVDKFGEQTAELIIFTVGQWLVPLTIYEIDQTMKENESGRQTDE